MGEYHANPNLNYRMFLAKQNNGVPFVTDSLYGNDLLQTQKSNFKTAIEIGRRDGIPQDQPMDYFLQRKFQANPYVRGMHPYTSNMLVDVVPSVYNTNPMAGVGGYEKNLASFNGTRPLATTLDEPQEIAQRLFEDEFKMHKNNPLSMQYTLNHARVEKQARGDMYDAFRLGIEKNNENVEADNDIVLQSKRQKGYNDKGVLPKGENEKSIEIYFNNQEPLRTGLFKEKMNKLNAHFTPAPQANILNAAGASGVPGGAVNLIGSPSGQNLPQVRQIAGGLNLFGAPPSPGPTTTSAPLGQGSAATVTPGPTTTTLTAGQRAALILQQDRDRKKAEEKKQQDERDRRLAERVARALAASQAAAGLGAPPTPPPGTPPGGP